MIERTNAMARGTVGALSDSVRKVLFNTFVTVGGMMAVTGLAAYFSLGLVLAPMQLLVFFLATFALLFVILAFRNSGFGLVLLAVFSGLFGMVLGPVINHFLLKSGGAGVVASAAGLTAFATFACASYAIASKRDFSQWRGFLMAATLVLIAASLISMFFPIPMLHVVISAVAAVLFIGWLLFDIGSILSGAETSYITAALNVYLSLLNIFTSLLDLLGIIAIDD